MVGFVLKVCDFISVVIPCKDRAGELVRSLKSIESQKIVPYEIVIVDDGSVRPLSDECPASAFPSLNIRFVRNDQPRGAARSRNLGASLCKGKVVAFLDSDDAFLPSYIEILSEFWGVVANDVGAVVTGFYWCDNDLRPYRIQACNTSIDRETLLRKGNYVGGCSVISVKLYYFNQVGGFMALPGGDDFGLLLNLAKVCKIEPISTPLVLYQSPSYSTIDNMTKNYGRQIFSINKLYRSLPDFERNIMEPYRYSMLLHLFSMNGDKWRAKVLLKYWLFRKKVVLNKIVLGSAFREIFGRSKFQRLEFLLTKIKHSISRALLKG